MLPTQVHRGSTPPPAWGLLTGGGELAASSPWLRAVQGRAQGEVFYFLEVDNGVPAAGLFATVAATTATDDAFNLYDIVAGSPRTMPLTDASVAARATLREQAPEPDAWFPNLVVALPSAECIPVGPQAGDPATMARLIEGVIDWAREHDLAAISFLYVRRRHRALTDVLSAAGCTPLGLSFTGELHLPGTRFDDYLSTLSKGRRKSVRRELRVIEDAGVVIERRSLDECLEGLVDLRLSLKRKYGRTPNPDKERASFTGLMAEFSPDQLHLLTAEVDGKLLGFGLDLIYNGVWTGVVSGTDYDDPRSDCVSFSLDFYSPIRRAYELGIRELQFGMAAWEAKQYRGCDLVAFDGYILPLRDDLQPALTASVDATELRFA